MSSTRTSTYSPSDVNVVINHKATGTTHVVSGYVEDSFINIERDSETSTHYTGIDNIATRVYMANTSGKVTVTLAQSSASNDVLSHIYNYDKANRNNSGLFEITVKDASGRSVMYSQEAYIGKVPNQQFGNSVQPREWVINTTRMEDYIGGNGLVSAEDAASIGSLGGTLADEWRA